MLPCCATESLSECHLLDDIKNKPYEVFLNDVMFCLCQECKVLWVPPCYRTYAAHPTSPLKANVSNFIRLSCRQKYAASELIWYYKSKEESIKEFETFEKYILDLKTEINKLYDYLIEKNISKFFVELLNIFINCIVFYERGMQDALCFGVTSTTELFIKYFTNNPDRSFDEILDEISFMLKTFQTENILSGIIKEFPDMFARDILFSLCMIYQTQWFPFGDKRYKFNRRSPLTINIYNFLRKFSHEIRVTCSDIEKYFEKGFTDGLEYIAEEISISSIPSLKSAEEVFLLVVKTACMAVKLHMLGVVGIISTTLLHLSEALRNCNERNNGRIFYLFDELASLQNGGKIKLKFRSS